MDKNKFYLLAETRGKLELKIKELQAKMHEADIEIGEAADHGTWHDNFSYEQAHQKREFYEIQINELKEKLKSAEIIKPNPDTSVVCLGHKVTLETGKSYTIVGEMDTDLDKGLISFTSPIGKELIGKRVGDKVGNSEKISAILLP